MKKHLFLAVALVFIASGFAEPPAERVSLWLEYIHVLGLTEKYDEAVHELEALKKTYPTLPPQANFQWHWLAARYHHAIGNESRASRNYRNAESLLNQLEDTTPFSADFTQEYIHFLRELRHYAKAVELYDKLAILAPKDETLHLEKARTLFWDQQYLRSLNLYRQSENRTHRLEGEAKEALYCRRPCTALARLNKVIDAWDENLEARFDRAQLLCGIGAFCWSLYDYNAILKKEPHHDAAKMMRDHLLSRSHGCSEVFGEFRDEKGRGELKDIEWWRTGFKGKMLCHPTGLHWGGEAFFTHYRPGNSDTTCAVHVALKGLKWWGPALTTEFRLQINEYKDHLPLTINGFFRHDTFLTGCCRLTLSADRTDILDNHYNFRKKIDFNRLAIEGWCRPYRPVTFLGRYGYGFFSDGNQRQEALLITAYEFCPSPHLLEITLNANWLEAANTSEFEPGNVIHPYWTPRKYWEAYALLHWRHHCFFPLFAGYERFYYDIKARGGRDDHNNWSVAGEGEIFWALNSCWEILLRGSLYRSRPYDDTQISASIRMWW